MGWAARGRLGWDGGGRGGGGGEGIGRQPSFTGTLLEVITMQSASQPARGSPALFYLTL